MCSRCAHDPSARAKHVNATTFKAGPDKRRHRFTRQERSRGYQSLMNGGVNNPPAYAVAWAWRKIRGHYRAKRRLSQAD